MIYVCYIKHIAKYYLPRNVTKFLEQGFAQFRENPIKLRQMDISRKGYTNSVTTVVLILQKKSILFPY